MLEALSLVVVLLAAPDAEEARKQLKIAYASQYEWREDKVANATFDFEWVRVSEDRKKLKVTNEARGSVVFVDGEIKRIHIPETGREHRDRVKADMEWVFRRFARKPFDEAFKEAKFQPPEEMADGNTRIVVDNRRYLVADNRITGMEINVGTEEKPSFVRLVLGPGGLGAGYGILEESLSHTFGGIKTERSQLLKVATVDGVPVPKFMRADSKDRRTTEARTIKFLNPRLNLDHPVAVDAELRDRVKAAWERRYTWPEGIRYEGTWTRELDNATQKGRWARDVSGEFQYLKDHLELTMDEDARLRERWRAGILRTSTEHLQESFDHLLPTPFEKAFPGCGFERDPDQGEDVVRVLGHPTMLALRLDDGAIVGHQTEEFGAVEWWSYKLKKQSDGRLRLDRMTRKIGKKKRTVRFLYSTKKGVQVFKSVERVVTANAWGGSDSSDVGIIKYVLKKLYVKVK